MFFTWLILDDSLMIIQIGILIEVLSFGSILGILVGSPGKFAVTFTLANLILLIGTGFLVGFDKQVKSMKKETRFYSSLVYIASSLGVLIAALCFNSALLVLALLLVSIASFIWYIASYIPFARECIINLFNKMFRQPEPESIY